MSSSIEIPKRKGKQRLVVNSAGSSPTPNIGFSPIGSTTSSTSDKSSVNVVDKSTKQTMSAFGIEKTLNKDSIGSPPRFGHERRTSLLSSSISKSEHTVINIGDDDRPRLITCVKASQGFDWNPDIFLPSYLSDRDHQNDLELRQDPVEDIFITEEEAEEMFPR